MKTLIELREENSLSQVDAAKRAGINKATWNKVENGDSKPQMRTLRKIAKAFNIPASEIKAGKEPEKPQADYTVEVKGFGKQGEEQILDALNANKGNNRLNHEQEEKLASIYNQYTGIKDRPFTSKFMIDVVNRDHNYIIKKRPIYSENNVYICVGAFLDDALNAFKDTNDAREFFEDAAIISPDWLNDYINVLWFGETSEDHLDRYYKQRAIKFAVDEYNKKRDQLKEMPFEFINNVVQVCLYKEHKGKRPYLNTLDWTIEALKKECNND